MRNANPSVRRWYHPTHLWIPHVAKKVTDEAPAEPTLSKADAVRAALAAGYDNPADGVAWIKGTHGLDVTNQAFSSYKMAEKKKREGAGGSKAVRVGRPSKNGHGDVLDVARQVKQLVDAHGADVVRECLKLFAD